MSSVALAAGLKDANNEKTAHDCIGRGRETLTTPDLFISGIVNEPVKATFASVEPSAVPTSALVTTDDMAGPPRTRDASWPTRVKKVLAPVT